MKKCACCKEDKNTECFGKDKCRKDGLNPYCKYCLKKKHETIKKEKPETLAKWRRAYNERHRMKIIDYRVKYHNENRDEILRKQREHYHKNKLERQRKSAIKRRNPEERKKASLRTKEWNQKNPGRQAKVVAEWKKQNPKKSAIHSLVLYAVRVGILIRNEICESCGIKCKTQGHHEDYEKPLEVKWLCAICHGEKHRKHR